MRRILIALVVSSMVLVPAVALGLAPGAPADAAADVVPAAEHGEQEQGEQEEGEQEEGQDQEGDEDQESGDSAYEEQVKAQLAQIQARLAPEFDDSSPAVIGELAQGEAHGFGIQVEAGRGYAVIGVCDADCGNLDLVLYTEDGEEITADRQPDDIPLLRFAPREDANVVVEMHMTLCVAETCVLGVQVFARDMEPEEEQDDGDGTS